MFSVIEWNDQREKVFLDRYALKDTYGNLRERSPVDMWERLAEFFGRGYDEIREFYNALNGFSFVPSGRILSGAGAGQQVTFYNCFVIGVRSDTPDKGNDSRHGIMSTLGQMIEITSRGGGVGVNWSVLRPKGTYIKGVNSRSSGANSWMRGADGLADQVRQGGSRTAALMFMLNDWHPDAVEFIAFQERFKRANFSVGISDRFMEAMMGGHSWEMEFPDTTYHAYNWDWDGDITKWKELGHPVISHGYKQSQDMWEMMCSSAHRIGSPGMVFLDRCNRQSNTWYLEKIVCTNPCGEQPLPVNGCCNLGSVNLTSFWDPKVKSLDWYRLGEIVRTAVKFLDNVIDCGVEVTRSISRMQNDVRRVGLGTMGLADIMLLSGIRYGSPESIGLIDKVYSFIRDEAYEASIDLAIKKGAAPAFEVDKFMSGSFIQTLPSQIKERIRRYGIRNLHLLTQAPTGTISILAGASSGIEPVFSKSYKRKDATGEYCMTHPLFDIYPESYHVTAKDIPVLEHVMVQAEVQKFVDSSVSKTINLPNKATVQDISEAFLHAYSMGCKGITIYRDGSLDNVLADEKTDKCAECGA